MAIWSAEIKELERLYESLKGQLPDLVKELDRLIKADDENMILLYSRRCLEVIITDLCEWELKRPRKTEPLKGIIDKLYKEEKVPSNIIASMYGLNEISTYGAHPKDFDPEQVRPVLINLSIILNWYLKSKDLTGKGKSEKVKSEYKQQTVFPQEKSIIVLPFENMSPDPDQEYFSDGLTEEIITDLSQIQNLLVISRSSAMTFKGTKSTIKEITYKVNVRYVLEGSVRKAGNNLRITAQLIDGLSDTHIWAEKYTGTIEDVFDIQEKVSASIANSLKIKLSSLEQKKIQERPIDNVFAYDCYKRAYPEIISMSTEKLDNGLKLFLKALDIAGENAVIYSGVALAYMMYANIGIEQEENLKKAEEFVKKALDLDKELAEAHFTLGGIILFKDGDMIKTLNHWVKAHENKPEDPEIMVYLSLGYDIVGQDEIARSLVEKCAKIDPINPLNDAIAGWNHFFGGRFDIALDSLEAAYNLDPGNPMHQYFKALILVYNDRADEAYDFICQNVEEASENLWSQVTIFLKYIIKKEKEKSASFMTPDFVKKIQRDLQWSYHIATFFSYIDNIEESLKWLENAVSRGFINYPLLSKNDKLLANIRNEERFKKLMERVKYEWENFEV